MAHGLIFILVALMLKSVGVTVLFFNSDLEKWTAREKGAMLEETRRQSVVSEESPVKVFVMQPTVQNRLRK
jgi:hypothetical protein